MGSSAARRRSLGNLPPTETLELGYELSLAPRLKLLLTFYRSDPAVKPVDEWQIKLSLLDYLRSTLSLSVPDDDLVLRKRPDLHKRKRDEPVATGTLYIRDLGFLKHKKRGDEWNDTDAVPERKYLDWKGSFLDQLGGIKLNLEGVKFRMTVEVPHSDEFELMKRSWEDYYTSQTLDGRSYSIKGMERGPDTLFVQGVPSRWFSEPRVSSKPSMLNTHTIFSALGKIRNLYVTCIDDIGKSPDAIGDVVPGLQSKVWVQFENSDEFSNAMRVLCGRSMHKDEAPTNTSVRCNIDVVVRAYDWDQRGSRLKVDYELGWDKDNFFRNSLQKITRGQERPGQIPASFPHVKNEVPRSESEIVHSGYCSARMKRFRD